MSENTINIYPDPGPDHFIIATHEDRSKYWPKLPTDEYYENCVGDWRPVAKNEDFTSGQFYRRRKPVNTSPTNELRWVSSRDRKPTEGDFPIQSLTEDYNLQKQFDFHFISIFYAKPNYDRDYWWAPYVAPKPPLTQEEKDARYIDSVVEGGQAAGYTRSVIADAIKYARSTK